MAKVWSDEELVTRIENWVWDRAYDMQGYLEDELAALEQWNARRRVADNELPWKGASNLDMGGLETMSHVESIHSRVMDVVRKSAPWVRFHSKDQKVAEQAQKYIRRKFTEQVPVKEFMDEWVHDALIGGLRRARVRWVSEYQRRSDIFYIYLTSNQLDEVTRQSVTEMVSIHLGTRYNNIKWDGAKIQAGMKGSNGINFLLDGTPVKGRMSWELLGDKIKVSTEYKQCTFRGPRIEMCLPEDFWKAQGDLQSCHYIIHRVWLSWDQVRSRVESGAYKGIDLVEDKEASSDPVNQTEGGAPMVETRRMIAGESVQVPKESMYEFLECFVLDDFGNGVLEDRFITVFRSKKKVVRDVLVSEEGYPCRPFSEIKVQPVPGKPEWAMGIPGMIREAANEKTAIHNLGMNIATVRGIPFGFRDAASEWGEDEMQVAPGKILPVDAQSGSISNAVYFPSLNGQIGELAQLQGEIDATAKSVDGLSDTQLLGKPQGKTLGQSELQQNEVNVRFEVLFDRIVGSLAAKNGMVFLLHMVVLLYHKFGDPAEIQSVSKVGTETVNFAELDSLAWTVEIDVLLANSQKKMQRAQAVMQTVMNPMLLQLKIVTPKNVYEAVKHVLQAAGVTTPDDFISLPPDVAQESVSPEIENGEMEGGESLPVHPADDDEVHLISHRAASKTLDEKSELSSGGRITQIISAHIRQHVLQQRAKRKSQQQAVQGLDFSNPQAVPSPGGMSFMPPQPGAPQQQPQPEGAQQ